MARKKKPKEPIKVEISDVIKEDVLSYAMSSYIRMVPAVVDGLKPVQRRVLYTMYKNKIFSFQKCATIVGRVMEYQPNGDAGIYGALLVMGQKDRYRNPMIVSQGNFGYITDTLSEGAAMRYTEAALAEYTRDFYFPEYFEYTVKDMTYIGDPDVTEPLVLPCVLPMGLIQGTTMGITVGYTSICPPHSLKSVAKCYKKYIEVRKDPVKLKAFDKFVVKNLKVDFPNNCPIDKPSEKGILTGKGRIMSGGLFERIPGERGRNIIRITQLPYLVEVPRFIQQCVDKMKRLESVARIDDLCSRDGIQIDIHVKKGKSVEDVIQVLRYETSFNKQFNYSLNMNDANEPRRLGVPEIFERHYQFKEKVISKFLEDKRDMLFKRVECLEGLLLIIANKENRESFINMITRATDRSKLLTAIVKKWKVKGHVAEYLVNRKFINMMNKYQDVKNELEVKTEQLRTVNGYIEDIDSYMIEEIDSKVAKYK